MYHLICLSRGIVPERIILRRTVSHCQKETEKKKTTEQNQQLPENKSPDEDSSQSNFDEPEVDQALTVTSEISKIEISKLTPTIAESSVLALVQVQYIWFYGYSFF